MSVRLDVLEIGQEVLWSGSWGIDSPVKTVVTDIEDHTDYDSPLESVEWERLNNRDIIVTLENGHWAYGDQIKKIK
jgi:hypothetical protein